MLRTIAVKIGLVFTTALSRPRRLAYQILAKGKSLAACPNRRSWGSDPAAHLAMGRALWLRREYEGAIGALGQSIHLSPSYALAHYPLAMVHCQIGDPGRAIDAADIADRLSP